ncbi:MAG: AAA family ATPase [Richelia sp. RM2_1_2]|nr:AAA family ATPase [Richelia sp. RM2_1_2]
MNNLECIICIGIPASGKSTWATEYVRKNPNYVRLNRDSYRYMLKDQGFTEAKIEKLITDMFYTGIDMALAAKLSLVIDNTNTKQSVINELVEYVQYRADVRYMLFPISLEEAISRDLARPKPVGEEVIKKMYDSYEILMDSFNLVNQTQKKYIYKEPITNDLLPHVTIFDLDGTLAHANSKRGYFEWDKVDRDDLDLKIYGMYKRHRASGDRIIIITGRSEESRKPTEEWLDFYDIKHDGLFMRPKDEFKKDTVIKRQIYLEHINDKFNVDVIYEDRQSVCKNVEIIGTKSATS